MGLVGLLATVFNHTESPLPYECQQCDSRFDVQHHRCPECDGCRVERVAWPAT